MIETGYIKTNALNIGTIKQCLNIDLFLGVELLKSKKLHYNFKDRLFTNLPNLTSINLDNFIEIPISRNAYDSYYYISIMINEKKTKFLVDLGFSGEIQLKKDISKTNNLIEITDVFYFGANSKQVKTIEKYNDVELSFPNNVRLINSISKIKGNKLNLIGIGFFKQFEEVIFDFKQKKIYVSKSKLIQNNIDRPIGFEINDNKIFISYINHSSEYFKSGFRVGNIVNFEDKTIQQTLLQAAPCEINELIRTWKNENKKPLVIK